MIDTKISPSLTVSLFCGIKVKRTITKFAIGILLFLPEITSAAVNK